MALFLVFPGFNPDFNSRPSFAKLLPKNLKLTIMIRKIVFGLAIAVAFMSCDKKEKQRLQSQVDSLRTELHESQQTAQTLQEIGVLIDSIDANRQLLRTDVVEGTSYADYKSRLKDINAHIKDTQEKIAGLEKSVKSAKGSYAATIKRLKADLELSTQQIAALQSEVEKMRGENESLAMTVSQRDSAITQNLETIQMREQDVANLETRVEDINTQSKASQADLYFAQAQALETAADRTKFAPRKKKETKREALELYKLSLSLGKQDAQSRIDELEKDLS
jgi:chromosome segregation ATPase